MPRDDAEDELTEPAGGTLLRALTRYRRALIVIGALVLAVLVLAWFNRERIADDIISGQLEGLGLPARYEIVSIGPSRQVLRNLSIGDPDRPDLTIERVEARIVVRWGIPSIGGVKLVKPRLFGSYRDGKLSFGSVDPVIFAESEEPFRMPDLRLEVVDGRGLFVSDFGPAGFGMNGKGRLRGGFAGELAGIAPELSVSGCKAEQVTLHGKLRVLAAKPRFSGPVRFAGLECDESGFSLSNGSLDLEVTAQEALDGADAELELKTGALALGENRAASIAGNARLGLRGDNLNAHYDLAANGVVTPQAEAGKITVAGRVRASDGFGRLNVEGDIGSDGVAIGKQLDASLADAASAGEGTLVESLAGQFRSSLAREARSSKLSASFTLRKTGEQLSLVLPRGAIQGGSGTPLVAISRLQFSSRGGTPLLTGNFTTGGSGMPQLSGRMEQQEGGPLVMRISMPEYRAGTARLSIPALMVTQSQNGALGFAGEAHVSGALPGGETEDLVIPVKGNWSERAGLSLWRDCNEIRFARLELAQLKLDGQRLTICPLSGGAVVRSDRRGTRVAGGVPGVELVGHIGETPVRIDAGPAGFAWPGHLQLREANIVLGEKDGESRFVLTDLSGELDGDVSGTFEGMEVYLNAVPLDIVGAAGNWRFVAGRLEISEASLRVLDREQVDRFEPLVARDAQLMLADNRILAGGVLREPVSSREIVRTEIRHDLSTGVGSADLFADGVTFDNALQPDTVSHLALGVIANAQGVLRGTGRIDWNEEEVTSSGEFSTDGLDFATAFGPVKGVSGTVTFTDLLGLVTAPDQKLKIASINPGIEVFDGVLTFEMKPGYEVEINGAQWPFLDGSLRLLPVRMTVGADEPLRYTLEIEGLNASRFIEQMDLGNLAATGTFDGTLPLIFDEDGGRIEGGILRSRPPGGNVAYVGGLTYEDLSAMANFAFDALRSLDYREMTVSLDGSLEGEIVSQVKFRGIGQGKGASSNFVTKQVAKLPIQFNVNLRAPFYQLITSFKSFYDPVYVRDPRTLGLLDERGRAVERPELDPAKLIPSQPPIQPPESEPMP